MYMDVYESAPFDNRTFQYPETQHTDKCINSIPFLCYERFPELFMSTELNIESPQIIISYDSTYKI